MGNNYDAIVIGGGHNGLTCAAYLARSGRKVLVLEPRAIIGGTAVTEELFPGFKFSTLEDGAGYLAPEIINDLTLAAYGLEYIPSDLLLLSLHPDGNHLPIWQDVSRTAGEIGRFSAKDAKRYPEFVGLMDKIAGVVAGLNRLTPPDLPEVALNDLRQLFPMNSSLRQLGRKNISQLLRVMPMSVADLLNEWFESDLLKGTIAANGVREITWGPMEAGTAYMLLYQWSGSSKGLFRSGGQVKGGMGAVSQALALAGQAFGADIRCGAAVSEIMLSGGTAVGVRLADGEVITADAVISALDPGTTFMKLVGPRFLPTRFLRHVNNIKYRGSTARLHLALNGLPEFKGVADRRLLGGAIQIGPSINYLQRAYDPVKYGDFSPHPYLDLRIPSLHDPTLAPDGCHTLSMTIKYAPYHLRNRDWTAEREGLESTAMDTLAHYSPNIRDLVRHSHLLTPADLEIGYHLPEGNLNHGEMTLDQFFHMRPIPGWAQYNTPIANLYLCGSGSHPGGGVTGLPGRNAAKKIQGG